VIGNPIPDLPADFALRGSIIRPIERDYGSATSGESEAAPARGLFGAKKSGRESCPSPARNAEAHESKTEKANGGGCGQRKLAFFHLAGGAAQAQCARNTSSSMATA
jgi:hypothetical protein